MRYPTNYIAITNKYSSTHKGIDLGWNSNHGGKNQSIYACANGQVTSIQKQTTGGNVIFISHANGLTSEYGHLQDQSIKVKAGDNVKLGDKIANMGATGKVSGNHLHFGLYKKIIKSGADIDKNKTVNPLDYLEVYSGQILSDNTKKNYKLKYYQESTSSQENLEIGIYKCLANMNIRKSPKVETNNHVKVKNTTQAARSALTSKIANANAVFKKGTKFTALSIINNKDGSIWAKNYSGYICISGKKKYCEKV